MLVGGGSSKASPISNNNPDKTTRAGGDYAFGNLNEFIAEAFSNGSFQELLETLDGDQKSSLWRDLVEAIANLLGITDSTMMFSIMDATFEIAEMSNKRAANIVDVSDVQASTRGEQAQRILEPVISFGRQQLRTGGALPYDIFRMTEQRGFNVNEKMLRAQNAVSDIEAAVKRSYGKSLDQLPEVEIARINEGLQNPLARAKLPTDVASAVGNARNLRYARCTKTQRHNILRRGRRSLIQSRASLSQWCATNNVGHEAKLLVWIVLEVQEVLILSINIFLHLGLLL
jgi:hypothetical protein